MISILPNEMLQEWRVLDALLPLQSMRELNLLELMAEIFGVQVEPLEWDKTRATVDGSSSCPRRGIGTPGED